jgi:hypothetical protein
MNPKLMIFCTQFDRNLFTGFFSRQFWCGCPGYRAWAKLLTLIDSTEFAVQALPPRKQEIYIKALSELRRHLAIPTWSTRWLDVCGSLCDPQWTIAESIELCSFDLTGQETLIEGLQLEQLRKTVEDLLKEISSAQLPSELRVFLLEKLREIQKAIDDYSFYGSAGLRKTLESIIGAAYFQDDAIKTEATTNPIAIKFWEIVKNTGALLSLVTNLEKLAPVAQHLLDAIKH